MSRILVLAPHPDDEAIGCGGAILYHLRQGNEVHIVFLTSGENGGHGRSKIDTVQVRETEARCAARVLGVTKIEFWHLPDGNIRLTTRAVEQMRKKLIDFKPDIVFVTHEREMHRDHRAAVRLLRRAFTGLSGQRPNVLGYEVWTPVQTIAASVDITGFLEKKLRAVRAYRSQCKAVGFVAAVRGLNRYRGEMHSWPGGDYAEVFTRVNL
jgi:N-acetylglucosamine malate deacetylase 1